MENKSNIDIIREMTETVSKKNFETIQLTEVLLKLIGGVSTIGLDGKYIEVNDEYATTCGYLQDELCGLEWLITVHPEDVDIAIKCYDDMVINGKSELSFRGVKKNGVIFRKKITLVSKKDIDGQLCGHYCFMREY